MFPVLQRSVSLIAVSKALQEFDLALRGKRKREKFLKDSKRKKELTVRLIWSISWSSLKSLVSLSVLSKCEDDLCSLKSALTSRS